MFNNRSRNSHWNELDHFRGDANLWFQTKMVFIIFTIDMLLQRNNTGRKWKKSRWTIQVGLNYFWFLIRANFLKIQFFLLFYRLSTCKKFNSSFVIPATIEFIFVKCESLGKTVYKNTHAIIRARPNIRQRLNEFKEKTKNNRPLSVLMLSIDSVSRLNLIRAMPKTAQHLYDSGWFELQGYNKVNFVKLFFPDFCFLFSINYDLRKSCKS